MMSSVRRPAYGAALLPLDENPARDRLNLLAPPQPPSIASLALLHHHYRRPLRSGRTARKKRKKKKRRRRRRASPVSRGASSAGRPTRSFQPPFPIYQPHPRSLAGPPITRAWKEAPAAKDGRLRRPEAPAMPLACLLPWAWPRSATRAYLVLPCNSSARGHDDCQGCPPDAAPPGIARPTSRCLSSPPPPFLALGRPSGGHICICRLDPAFYNLVPPLSCLSQSSLPDASTIALLSCRPVVASLRRPGTSRHGFCVHPISHLRTELLRT
ncbi:hypothetical protein CDD83_7410 [Cordyceps sp. RAO-2017]|nr:hypothetical protein CDD83_7410 [Cordyceps sp. RAO-2017]